SNDFKITNGGEARTDGRRDGALVYETTNLDGLADATLTLDARVVKGSFEEWGSSGGDMVAIELLMADGTVVVLDTFTGSGSTLTGSETGQTIANDGGSQLTYDLSAIEGDFQLRLVSDISARGEKVAFDDVTIAGTEIPAEPEEAPDAPAPAPAPAAAPVDPIDLDPDAITVFESETAGDLETLDDGGASILDNDDLAGATLVAVEGAAANIGQFVDLAGGGRAKVNADGTVDFDADGDFDSLAFNETAQTSFTYTVERTVPGETTVFDIPDRVADPLGAIILDEETIDNGLKPIEEAAAALGVQSDELVNDDNPTEVGNPALLWNEIGAGQIVTLTTGQDQDEGVFGLPSTLVGKEGAFSLADFVAGTVPQSRLDEVRDVNPLDNEELASLVGNSFVGVVYDSDVSINYDPLEANLQGARYGLFYFTVLGITSDGPYLDDLIVRVDPVPADMPPIASLAELLDGSADQPDFTLDVGDATGALSLDIDGGAGDTVTVWVDGVAVATEVAVAGVQTLSFDVTNAATVEVEFAGEGTLTGASVTAPDVTETATETVTITVVGENEPPVAEDNAYSGVEGMEVSGNIIDDDTGAGVDSDPEDQALSVSTVALTGGASVVAGGGTAVAVGVATEVLTASGKTGTLTVEADGTLSFVPSEDFDVLDEGESDTLGLEYTVVDTEGAASAEPAEVTITINGEDDLPPDGGGGDGPDFNVVYLIDTSSSMFQPENVANPLPEAASDFNGDGINNFIDLAVEAVAQMSDAWAAAIGASGFDLDQKLFGFNGVLTEVAGTFDAGEAAFETALDGLTSGESGTDFAIGFQGVIDYLDALLADGNTAPVKVVLFTDALQTEIDSGAETLAAEINGRTDVGLDAVAINSVFDLSQLVALDALDEDVFSEFMQFGTAIPGNNADAVDFLVNNPFSEFPQLLDDVFTV
ncbi:MAG: vWA domain-containing protein, partial [Actinomycetota bacterium]